MRFSSYLASSWPSIAIAVVCAGLCAFILLASGKMGLSVRADSVPGESFTVTIGFPTNKMHYFE